MMNLLPRANGVREIARSRQFCSTCRLLAKVIKPGEPSRPSRPSIPHGNARTREAGSPLVRAGRKAFLAGYDYPSSPRQAGAEKSREQGSTALPSSQLANVKQKERIHPLNKVDSYAESRPTHQNSVRQGRDPRVGDEDAKAVMRGEASFKQVDTSQPLTSILESNGTKSKIKFVGINLETALPRIFQTKLQIFRSPLFTLRAYPSHLLPARPAPPFPSHLSARETYDGSCVYLAVVSSKAQVGKLAVERNRSRRRFRAVIESVVNASLGISADEEALELVTPEYAYIASVTAAIHDAPFEDIVTDVVKGLRHLERVQPRRRGDSGGRLPQPKYLLGSVAPTNTMGDMRSPRIAGQ